VREGKRKRGSKIMTRGLRKWREERGRGGGQTRKGREIDEQRNRMRGGGSSSGSGDGRGWNSGEQEAAKPLHKSAEGEESAEEGKGREEKRREGRAGM
jgi:hypothetical protein